MRVTEKDLKEQCRQVSILIGKPVEMRAECGIYYCAIIGEHNSIILTLTDRDSKKVVFYQMSKIINILNYMGYKKLSIHYGEA